MSTTNEMGSVDRKGECDLGSGIERVCRDAEMRRASAPNGSHVTMKPRVKEGSRDSDRRGVETEECAESSGAAFWACKSGRVEWGRGEATRPTKHARM